METAEATRVQDTLSSDPAPPSDASSLAVPFFAAVALLGLVAIVAGLIALIAGGDRSGLLRDDNATADEVITDLLRAPDSPVPAPSDTFEPFDGQVLPPAVTRDLAQQSLDLTDRVTIQVGDETLTITRLANGHCQFASSSGGAGSSLVIAPSGVPSDGSAEGGSGVLVPDPNGPFSGIRIDEDGVVTPVPRGYETPDTLLFGFDDEGVRTLGLPGSTEQLRITPDGRLGIEQGRTNFSSDAGIPADVRRDAVQGRLDRFGEAELSVNGAPIDIVRHPDGMIQMVGPSGASTFLRPESVTPDGTRIQGQSLTYAPAPSGPYAGFRVDDQGDIAPVPRGEETEDMFSFGFGPTGVRELYLPYGDGQAVRVSPDGQRSTGGAAQEPASPQLPASPAEPGAPAEAASPEDPALPEEPAPVPETAQEPVAEDDPEPPADENEPPADENDEAGDTPWTAILIAVGIGLLVIAGICGYLVWRRRSAVFEPEPEALLPDLGPVVADVPRLFDTLVGPRQAILDAYDELESGLAARELVRARTESPRAFLQRTIGANPAAAEPLGRLTDLFELARFSDYDITEGMRSDAIAAASDVARAYAREPELV